MLQRLQYKSNNRVDSYQHCLKRWAGEAASSFDDPSRLTDTQISQAASETGCFSKSAFSPLSPDRSWRFWTRLRRDYAKYHLEYCSLHCGACIPELYT